MTVVLRPSVAALQELTVSVEAGGAMRPAGNVLDGLLAAGVKSEVLNLEGVHANLAEKSGRQVFARIPGIFVYDMDGSGNQLNIATRGLDPHRSWELNVRQDGVVVNSDLYGYPASHYSLPLEAVERIEHVRGTAALQYGPQFGGLVNYVTRLPDPSRSVGVRTVLTAGSNGLVNGFAAVGGRVGGVSYQSYGALRRSEGYRENARSEYDAQYLAVWGDLTPELSVRGQVGRSYYRYRLPGPLTDAMFRASPRSATRSRNWFSPDIVVPSVRFDWRPGPSTRLTAQLSATLGTRSSVQFVGFATTPDEPVDGVYGPRIVDIDEFASRTVEVRVTRDYRLFGLPTTLSAGGSFSYNDLHRRQQGRGTRGSDYDLTVDGPFGRDVWFRSRGGGFFAEQMVAVTPRWSIIPGVRLERGRSRLEGRLAYVDPVEVPTSVRHAFPLFGVRSEYRIGPTVEAYGGWSEAYRPMILKDVLPENALERSDPDLKDASGWTLETGLRGTFGAGVRFDLTLFALRYNNRFGTLLVTDPDDAQYVLKTNVGSSLTRGLELSLDLPLVATQSMVLSGFTATALYDAHYKRGTVLVGGRNESITGNRVESVPKLISRTGLHLLHGRASGSTTVSYVASSYADALNTEQPSPTGAVGLVPAYTLVDVGLGYQLDSRLTVRLNVGNLFERSYFTKRPAFYPGPGVWPSDGRTVQLSGEMRL